MRQTGLWSAALSGGAERNCSWCNTGATHLTHTHTHTDLCRVIVMWALSHRAADTERERVCLLQYLGLCDSPL